MALNFNGTTQYLYANTPVTSLPLTIACWFTANNLTAQKVLAQVFLPSTATGFGSYRIVIPASTSVLRAIHNNATTPQTADVSGVTTGVWMHAAGVFTSNSSRTAYLNGVGNTTTGTAPSITVSNYSIGGNINNGVAGGWHNGLIAEVGLWSAALTVGEINSLAKGVSPMLVRPQSLACYTPLIRDLVDLRGGLAITNNNGATVASHPRIYS